MAKAKDEGKPKPETRAKCFIIMPLSTPENLRETYTGGDNHFLHILEHLFKPAVRKAGFDPVEPKSEGSDLIHKNIVDNLASAKMVLCDMSCLNPNVFFELGIRTALNKPVCLVKDTLKKLPFDTGLIHCHPYIGTLNVWELDEEIKKLAGHLEAAKAKKQYSVDKNIWWQFMGLDFKGELIAGSGDVVDLIRYFHAESSDRLHSIEQVLISQSREQITKPNTPIDRAKIKRALFQEMVKEKLQRYRVHVVGWRDGQLEMSTLYKPDDDIRDEIRDMSHNFGFGILLSWGTQDLPVLPSDDSET